MVTGLEHLAFPGAEELGMWQNLNISRPRWVRELPRTVVLWVTEDAHRLLATRAPDLYRFRSTAIDLRLPRSSEEERVAELRSRIRSITASPATRLRWLTELWRKTKEPRALEGLFVAALEGRGRLPEDAEKVLALRTTLDLSHTPVSDVSPLAGLTALEGLGLTHTQVSDVSPLAGLTHMEILDLSFAPVSDASPLAGLTALRVLNLSHTQVSDASPLAGLTALRVLSLSHTQVSDVSPLAGLTALRALNLSHTQVSDVSPLAGLTALLVLNLSHTQVSDVSPLAGLTHMETLDLSFAPVSDASPLAGFTALRALNLLNTPVLPKQVDWLRRKLPDCDIVF
jgi:Leucine-rich repeat (LRR) protein